MIAQLIAKEFREHRWIALGVALLAVAEYLAFLEFSLRHEPPTALVAAINFSWGVGPMVAAFTARRLFVLEQEHGTIQLLRSLPVSPATVLMTKFVLGLLFNLALNAAVLWGSAWALQNQEVLTADWVGRLTVQVGVYIFAWFALASFHAQLGAYRFAVWLVVLVALTSLDDVFDEPLRTVFWTAPLAADLETTRYATPWETVWIALAWAVGALTATVVLAVYRGGTWVDAWFTPMSGRRRAEVTGAAVLFLMVFEVASSASGRQPGLLPSATSELRVADATLRPLAERLKAAADQARDAYGLPPPPRVLLRVRRDDRPEPVLTTILKSSDLIVGVRAEVASEEVLRLALTDIFVGQAGGHWERVSTVGVWAMGFAPFLLKDETLGRTAARLADLPPEMLDDYDAVRQRFGRRGAEAAGWLAWQAANEVGGEAAVRALAVAVFGSERTATTIGLIAARTVDPPGALEAAGVDLNTFHTAWRAKARQWQTRFADAPQWQLRPVRLERAPEQLPTLAWRDLPIDVTAHRVELWWSVAQDLYPRPVPQDELRVGTVDYQSGYHRLYLDPRLRIVSTWVVDGEVLGWSEVDR